MQFNNQIVLERNGKKCTNENMHIFQINKTCIFFEKKSEL